jgi:hypothetical protein
MMTLTFECLRRRDQLDLMTSAALLLGICGGSAP